LANTYSKDGDRFDNRVTRGYSRGHSLLTGLSGFYVSEEAPLILDDKNLMKIDPCSESSMSVFNNDITLLSSVNLLMSCISTVK